MRCYHLITPPLVPPVCNEPYQYLEVGNGQWLLVHADCHQCEQGTTRLPHILETGPVAADVAAALTQWGVLETDTLAQAMFKVAADWSAAWP
jgi:hypothetical protein